MLQLRGVGATTLSLQGDVEQAQLVQDKLNSRAILEFVYCRSRQMPHSVIEKQFITAVD